MNRPPRLVLPVVLAWVLVACTDSGQTTGRGTERETAPPSTGAEPRPSDGYTALDPIVDRAAHAASLLPHGVS